MKKQTRQHSDPGREKVALKIAAGIIWIQKRWATAMSRAMGRLNPGARKVLLVTCAVLMMLYSGYLVAFSFGGYVPRIDSPARIKIPRINQRTDTLRHGKVLPGFMIPVKRFHRYLDSLGGTSSGKRIRDSMLRHRPGLLDSIRHVEQLWCK